MRVAPGRQRQALQMMRLFEQPVALAGAWQQRLELAEVIVHRDQSDGSLLA